jgi:UDP-N-acetylglucosamine 2-epimerase (non-hydrolysing)
VGSNFRHLKNKTIALVVGTRPEAIKMAPLYRALERSSQFSPYLLSTGQHREMLSQTLNAFDLKADADLALMQANQTLPDLTGRVLTAVTAWLAEQRPAALLVQGDTTTAFAAALARFYRESRWGMWRMGFAPTIFQPRGRKR